jgi:hypothetical protein
MATIHITEFIALGRDARGNELQVGKMPEHTTQVVTYTTSTQSAAFGAETKFIRVIADAAAHLAFGSNPTATANSLWVPADTSEYFSVVPGQKVAAYDGSS